MEKYKMRSSPRFFQIINAWGCIVIGHIMQNVVTCKPLLFILVALLVLPCRCDHDIQELLIILRLFDILKILIAFVISVMLSFRYLLAEFSPILASFCGFFCLHNYYSCLWQIKHYFFLKYWWILLLSFLIRPRSCLHLRLISKNTSLYSVKNVSQV